MISAEAFAKRMYDKLRVGTLASLEWEQLDPSARARWIGHANDLIGEFLFFPVKPGEVPPDDKGPIALLVSHNEKNGDIRIDFGKELKWFILTKDLAIQFGITVLQHCGVPVNVQFAPAPGDPV